MTFASPSGEKGVDELFIKVEQNSSAAERTKQTIDKSMIQRRSSRPHT